MLLVLSVLASALLVPKLVLEWASALVQQVMRKEGSHKNMESVVLELATATVQLVTRWELLLADM
jgi:hypothetical protein